MTSSRNSSRPRRSSPANRAKSWRGSEAPDRKRWEALRLEVLARDDCTCQSCGYANDGYGLEVDHIIPLADLVSEEYYRMENLQTLCRDCHLRKTMLERANPVLTWEQFMIKCGAGGDYGSDR